MIFFSHYVNNAHGWKLLLVQALVPGETKRLPLAIPVYDPERKDYLVALEARSPKDGRTRSFGLWLTRKGCLRVRKSRGMEVNPFFATAEELGLSTGRTSK